MKPAWNRDQLSHLLSLSATLAGLSITGVTLSHTIRSASSATTTIVDDILAMTSLMFLLCCYISFFALRATKDNVVQKLIKLADGLFLVALTSMVGSGFIMLYTIL